ncbi:uncharacterized protein BDZ99DRAFT_465926 [Mytilinidion resinicola]|uniref:C2H2-type domain-containing protein n=1 Tax=Mytilinidion resinicola TaxID=574789 RepID=A0A6A6YBT5_9PEZI|nr:uncharacterized protein BDZ99DRAFT_465926 [Mytilinidion resinicola]KAF2806286.1 hypothetical protein BDZ99DRAFT_465926 [Mytilinidion resinicola]
MSSLDLVLAAIDAADPDRLRITLKRVCSLSNDTLELVCSELLVAEKAAESQKKASESGGNGKEDNSKALKRKRVEYNTIRFQTCIQCEQEFDATKNEEGCCRWHKGELEADEDPNMWPDFEDWRDGEYDDWKDEFPERFLWSCCKRRGDDEEVCCVGKHMSAQEHASGKSG